MSTSSSVLHFSTHQCCKLGDINTETLYETCRQNIEIPYLQQLLKQSQNSVTIARLEGNMSTNIAGVCIFNVMYNVMPIIQHQASPHKILDIDMSWTDSENQYYGCDVYRTQNSRYIYKARLHDSTDHVEYAFDPFLDDWKFMNKKHSSMCYIKLLCASTETKATPPSNLVKGHTRVGSKLLNYMEGYMRDQKVEMVYLHATLGAMPFYWKQGYRFISTDDELDDNPINAEWASFFEDQQNLGTQYIKLTESLDGIRMVIRTIESVLVWGPGTTTVASKYQPRIPKASSIHTLSPTHLATVRRNIQMYMSAQDGFMMMKIL